MYSATKLHIELLTEFASLSSRCYNIELLTEFRRQNSHNVQTPGPTTFSWSNNLLPLANVNEVSGYRRRGRHRGTHQMRAASASLTALKVSIRSRGASLTRL
jgi:hypothetical protein